MIRINLLGQIRPKAAKQAVPMETTVQMLFLTVAVAIAVVILGLTYVQEKRQLDDTNKRIAALRAEKASLQAIKQDVDRFENEKSMLQQRINVIETLQKNRSGAQDLLQMVANTVVRVDTLWLTAFSRTGSNLNIEGEAGSIDAVANFITEMKRSGYFDKVEINAAKENDLVPSVTTYFFTMTAGVTSQPTPGASAQPAAAATPAQPAAKGRS